MKSLKLSVVLTLMISAETGWADGLDTWTWRNPLPTGNGLSAIAYGNGQFVAVGAWGGDVRKVIVQGCAADAVFGGQIPFVAQQVVGGEE
jgi:hypothetical protein